MVQLQSIKLDLLQKNIFRRKELITETFTPVAKFITIQTILVVAALKEYSINQIDISIAYVHTNVESDLYMLQLESYEIDGENGERLVCQFNKSIYELK
jgi:hypothetical protein